MNDFPPCDPEILKNGKCIAIMADMEPEDYEEMCISLSGKGYPTDWNFMGGRAVIRTLGNPEEAQSELQKMFEEAGNPTTYIIWHEG